MKPSRRIAIIAGSGLDLTDVLDEVAWQKPFDAFEGLSASSVPGHHGTFVQGACGPHEVILQQGRRHFYEGLSFQEVTATVHVLASLGTDRILFTNAAGGLKPELAPGMLLAIEHITVWPYRGWSERPEALSPDWVMPGCDAQGDYVWVHGPSYETRAEIGVLRDSGASAVGMSTAPELAAAHALGMRTAAVSCITNNCCRIGQLTHDDVLKTARCASQKLCAILREGLPSFAELG